MNKAEFGICSILPLGRLGSYCGMNGREKDEIFKARNKSVCTDFYPYTIYRKQDSNLPKIIL